MTTEKRTRFCRDHQIIFPEVRVLPSGSLYSGYPVRVISDVPFYAATPQMEGIHARIVFVNTSIGEWTGALVFSAWYVCVGMKS